MSRCCSCSSPGLPSLGAPNACFSRLQRSSWWRLSCSRCRGGLDGFRSSSGARGVCDQPWCGSASRTCVPRRVRWAPEEAVTRADLTVTAVEQSATAHWKRPSTIQQRCGSSSGNRFQRSSWRVRSGEWGWGHIRMTAAGDRHAQISAATMVQIGTEMGALGLLGYVGLLGATAGVCARRARGAQPGTFQRSVGLGLLAATVCLFLLDFSGTRFRAHTVTSISAPSWRVSWQHRPHA